LHLLYTIHLFTATAIGACIGSFLGVVVSRSPQGMSLWSPGSHCDRCQTPLAWYDNLPVISWLLLKARCRHCGAPIPVSLPLTEMLGALVAWLCYRRFVPSLDAVDAPHLLAFTTYFGFCALLITAAITDLRVRIIPDGTSLYAAPFGILSAGLLQWMGYTGWLGHGWQTAVLGAFLAGAPLWLLSTLWYRLRGREGLALGDVKLMTMVGAFLGPLPGAWLVLLLTAVISILGAASLFVAGKKGGYLPFAPALSIAGISYVLFGDLMVHRWLPGMAGFLP